MHYLLLSIISSTCIFLIFKQFQKFGINNFQAIVVNYITAALCALFANGGYSGSIQSDCNEWIYIAIFTGVLFISMFNIIAITTQKVGISVASVATKVSLIIPVIFAIYLYGDTLNILKVAGITIALLSVALTFYKPGYKLSKSRKIIVLPIILFLGTGLLDTILKYTQETVISAEDFNRFSTVLFAVAGTIGFVVAGLNIVIYKTKFSIKSVYAGVLLGLPNYGSIYFLLQAFENSGMKSSVLFPVNNISIVVFSALAAIVFFKEKVSKLNMLGILLALVSIAIISVA